MSIPLGSSEELLKYDYPNVIIELLKNKIFHFDEITVTSIPKILNEYRKTHINFNNIMLARENKDFTYEKQLLDTAPVTYNISLVAPKVDTKNEANCQNDVNNTTISEKACKHNNLLLSEFVEKYVQTKLSDRKWKEHSVADHKNRLNSLQSILGDIPIQDITREDFRRFRDTFAKLPLNYKKMAKYKGKNIEEIAAIPHEKTYSVKTINITVEAIASMFEWGVREGHLEKNNAKSLQIKDDRQDIALKDAFTPEDIQKLFFAKEYSPDAFAQPAYYWAPLIGLYPGMRLEEICQLACNDIKKDKEILYFDINTHIPTGSSEIKILKNKNAHTGTFPYIKNFYAWALLNMLSRQKKQEMKDTKLTKIRQKRWEGFFSLY